MVAPVPDAASFVELVLPPKKEIVAEEAPGAAGVKVRLKGTLWPAAIVTGNMSPPNVNCALLEVTEDTVTLPPLALILPFCVWLEFTFTLPKLMEAGVTVKVPVVAGLAPVPENETARLGSEAFDDRPRAALSLPVAVGANVTDKFAVLPAASEYGKASPLTL